ncbi:MAG: ATP-binding protein [Verrucomicrobiae bacterium]|nr:ATP-binding protein [Verrucomicrobiae bacterium]
MKRFYENVVREHLASHRQMAFLSGPRQVGKTTTARVIAPDFRYYNWDRQEDRRLVLQGADAIARDLDLQNLGPSRKLAVFDEIHRYPKWKSFLKGFFDGYGEQCHLLVTGRARLNVYKRGGDSLMGRYFPYRMHPLSIAELIDPSVPPQPLRQPRAIEGKIMEQLLRFGGFPEPFLKASERFHRRWSDLRTEMLFREDIRDGTRIHEAGQIQVLAELLASRAGQLVNYSSLAAEVNVAVDTIRRWVAVLEAFFHVFAIRPWHRNVAKSLRKQPKIYLRDWSALRDPGARLENFVACHLLKAAEGWTDLGFGNFELFYLRDKMQREVDFLIARDKKPWFLVEVKSAARKEISPALVHFQAQTGAPHAFQVAGDLGFVHQDCFSMKKPARAPLATLLSQLL